MNRLSPVIVLSAFVLLPLGAQEASAQDIVVHPYLQLASPESIWVSWETDGAVDGVVEWGLDDALGGSVESATFDLVGGGVLHEASITGLAADTRYVYRVTTGDWVGPLRDFRTPPARGTEGGVRIVAMSDMQRDGAQPDKFREVVEDGVIAWAEETYGQSITDAIGMVLLAGDLVDDGHEYEDWVHEFFAPSRELFGHVPVYPVLGNHEGNTHFFFDYFHLPDNGGSALDQEHWWSVDHGNVRVIGLDTNDLIRLLPQQRAWLTATLADACDDPEIDFLFAQFHHPAQSELWVVGEIGFSMWIVEQLEQFTSDCGKPSIHFYGHTHGYARGQSRDHQHLWVNAASAGGSLDDWGEYPQIDYAETTISSDQYGFVVVDTVAGDDPEFTLTRVTRGKPDAVVDNVVQDQITVRTHNNPPARPRPLAPAGQGVSAECATLRIEADYADPDGDALQAVHWQVAATCEPFGDIVAEEWVQASNLYYDEDTQAGIALDAAQVAGLPADADLCWRVRVRDAALAWSDWSVAVPVHTSPAVRTGNLVVGGDAEDGADAWTSRVGVLEALDADQSELCDGAYVGSGDAYFAPAGQCAPAAAGEAVQRVDVATHAALVDSGGAEVFVAALGGTYATAAEASVHVEFVGEDGSQALGASDPIVFRRARWERHAATAAVPVGTRFVDVVIGATRDGEGDGGYVDDVVLEFGPSGEVDCAASGDGEIPDDPAPADPAPDAGPDTGADAGTDADDAAVTPDADTEAPDAPAGDTDTSDPGSARSRDKGCAVAGAGSPAWGLLGLVALAALRRRRA